jgi:hypothetical protein
MNVVTRFIDLQLAQERRRLPGSLPEQMLDLAVPSDGDWHAWKPIASTVTPSALAAFESELGIRLPAAYRALLTHVHFLELHPPKVRFESHPPRWQDAKRGQQAVELLDLDGETLVPVAALGLFVIGSDLNDGGPICLDLRAPRMDDDCPVVFVDHESGERVVLFSSTIAMFSCFAMAVETGVNFFDARRDTEVSLARKRDFMLAYLAIDPHGAGGPGRGFWSGGLAEALRAPI